MIFRSPQGMMIPVKKTLLQRQILYFFLNQLQRTRTPELHALNSTTYVYYTTLQKWPITTKLQAIRRKV